MSAIHIPWTIVPAGEQSVEAPLPEPPPPPADLDALLDELDAALATLDLLSARQREFPRQIAEIDAKLEKLQSQDICTLAALESRQAEQGKLANMKLLADSQDRKTRTAIAAGQETVCKIGAQAASLVEKLWWDLHTKAFAQAETQFNRLFFRAYEWGDVLSKFKPLVLLDWLKPPEGLRTGSLDTKIIRFRQLRVSADRLREFERMSFEEIAQELELQEAEARERRRQYRPPPGYPEPEPETPREIVQLL
jgi:hypothetical protein